MITATPRPAPLSSHALLAPVSPVRPARPEDAAELAALSGPFVRSGALRERPLSLYAAHAADFLVARAPGGAPEGCVGLRVHAAAGPGEGRGPVGVLYNFCVAGHRQGHGVGAALLRAALAAARRQSLAALFTATTGGGGLFLRYGFTPTTARLAPPAWAASLDPGRGARVLRRAL
ncbi:GNAT family N-acetyltransferase [Streptomyces sp. NBC_01498]|uniref:GNAT family N-acetyltransferase n=1 Tax=Streptomyces sp. NBC_01498 TaxID=2975870 RepID=UPI002E7AEE86|nr:GNAT family N-acetyltransferase [Streptomyces sp. NBC_01498]WTL23276.1 GNAT family N-acetyltransferase [Streptomyces sp. NBC_01498]